MQAKLPLLAISANSSKTNRMTHPHGQLKLNEPHLTMGSKTDDQPPVCSGPPPNTFYQSLSYQEYIKLEMKIILIK